MDREGKPPLPSVPPALDDWIASGVETTHQKPFEKVTIIERGRFEFERDLDDPDEEEAPRISSEGISGPPTVSISSEMVPQEAWPVRRSEYGPPGRWEIITRFTPEK